MAAQYPPNPNALAKYNAPGFVDSASFRGIGRLVVIQRPPPPRPSVP